MMFLVKYVCFHPDNYQGGSGKSFSQEVLIEASGQYTMKDLKEFIYEETRKHAEISVPFIQDSKFTLTEVRTFI